MPFELARLSIGRPRFCAWATRSWAIRHSITPVSSFIMKFSTEMSRISGNANKARFRRCCGYYEIKNYLHEIERNLHEIDVTLIVLNLYVSCAIEIRGKQMTCMKIKRVLWQKSTPTILTQTVSHKFYFITHNNLVVWCGFVLSGNELIIWNDHTEKSQNMTWKNPLRQKSDFNEARYKT